MTKSAYFVRKSTQVMIPKYLLIIMFLKDIDRFAEPNQDHQIHSNKYAMVYLILTDKNQFSKKTFSFLGN